MSAAVGAALKKIAVALVSNPKVLKTIFGIILGIIIIIIMPIVAVLGIFSGDIEINTDELHQQIVANMDSDQAAELQAVEDTMYAIEDAMIEVRFPSKVREAQVLYVTALYEHAGTEDFVSLLVGCFAADQSDEQLISTVNSTFGASINLEEFQTMMSNVKKTGIDTSKYTDVNTKNNLDLVLWAKNAYDCGWGYVYGTYGTVLDESLLTSKISQYPDEVGGNEEFIRQNWLGGRTADCVGLIKGYGWYDAVTGETVIGGGAMPDIGADTMHENATEKGSIDTMPEIPGLAVWHEGHIGIYIGDGYVVEAMNTLKGVRLTELEGRGWTDWLKIPYITYMEGENDNEN